MSNYQWNEKQIIKAYESRKHKKSWLSTRDIRSGIPAKYVRQLMKIMVDRSYAFDNRTSPDSDLYKICFNLDKKEQMIREIQDSRTNNIEVVFDTSLLSDPRLADLPPKDFLKFAKSSRMRLYWDEMKIEWQEIHKEFFRCQKGGNMKDSQYIHVDLLSTGILEWQIKDMRAFVSWQANTFINMYKALKIGWQEIKHVYPRYHTYNELFLGVLSAHYSVKLFNLCNFKKSKQKERTISRKLDIISKFPEFITPMLKILHEDANSSDKKYWKIIIENYIRDPHGQGLQDAFNILLRYADEDEHEKNYIKDALNDFCRAFSNLSDLPRFRSYDDFCMYFEMEEKSSDDPFFNYLVELSDADVIKEILRKSNNSKVTDAVFEWANAEKEIIEVSRTISRRKAQQPDLYNIEK